METKLPIIQITMGVVYTVSFRKDMNTRTTTSYFTTANLKMFFTIIFVLSWIAK